MRGFRPPHGSGPREFHPDRSHHCAHWVTADTGKKRRCLTAWVMGLQSREVSARLWAPRGVCASGLEVCERHGFSLCCLQCTASIMTSYCRDCQPFPQGEHLVAGWVFKYWYYHWVWYKIWILLELWLTSPSLRWKSLHFSRAFSLTEIHSVAMITLNEMESQKSQVSNLNLSCCGTEWLSTRAAHLHPPCCSAEAAEPRLQSQFFRFNWSGVGGGISMTTLPGDKNRQPGWGPQLSARLQLEHEPECLGGAIKTGFWLLSWKDGAWSFIFLTSSQVIWMVLVQEPL